MTLIFRMAFILLGATVAAAIEDLVSIVLEDSSATGLGARPDIDNVMSDYVAVRVLSETTTYLILFDTTYLGGLG